MKVREYRAVPPIRRYVILEYSSIGLTVLERASGDEPWCATALTAEDTLQMPEIGIEIPVAGLYQGVDLPGERLTGAYPCRSCAAPTPGGGSRRSLAERSAASM